MAVSILSVSYDNALLITRHLMLEAAGYSVTSALGFTDAQVPCKEGAFDLMILGHSIPQNDKRALIEIFRLHNQRARVIGLLRAGESLIASADYHLSPEDPKQLMAAIAEIAAGSEPRPARPPEDAVTR